MMINSDRILQILCREKRDINPLSVVGDLVDWTFGLVSNNHLKQFKAKIETSLSQVESESNKIHEYIRKYILSKF